MNSAFDPATEAGTKVEGAALGGRLLADFGEYTLSKVAPIDLADSNRRVLDRRPRDEALR